MNFIECGLIGYFPVLLILGPEAFSYGRSCFLLRDQKDRFKPTGRAYSYKEMPSSLKAFIRGTNASPCMVYSDPLTFEKRVAPKDSYL